MILVFNSGSSSLKFGCFDAETAAVLATGVIGWSDGEPGAVVRDGNGAELLRRAASAGDCGKAVEQSLRALRDVGVVREDGAGGIRAVGHRVVHGGTRFRASVLVDTNAKEGIEALSVLAPMHNPQAIEVMNAVEASLGRTLQVAVFDTAFFAGLPARSHVYPLPYSWYADWGIRRFGFHGISHEYCSRRVAELSPAERNANLVICHLGNGCSASAVRDGRPVATTMGFTPLEGLMMGTRAGSVDPGILLHVQRHGGLGPSGILEALNEESGLLGVSGVSRDYREVERAAIEGGERARLALDLYADRVRSAIGALAVTLGAVDALVFTGGVGENSASLRAAACDGLQCLDIHLDPEKNGASGEDREISARRSRAKIWIIRAQEELMIARETRRVLGEREGPGGART